MSRPKRIAVVGSRDFPFPGWVRGFIADLPLDVEIVSGGARGVDTIAADMSKGMGRKVTVFPADWSIGRHAGFKRNAEIVKYADEVVAFQLNESVGTAHTIRLARNAGKLRQVVSVEQLDG